MLPDLAEPPRLDLPASATKFEYGGTSLPVGFRFPLSYSISYADKHVNHPMKELKSSSVGGVVTGFEALDLKYRRKPGIPTQVVPAPLYFRQSAAAVHPLSPMTGPSSPPRVSFSPRFSPAGPPTTSLALPSAFSLPPAVVSAPPSLPRSPRSPRCGRPGCSGTNASAISKLTGRRSSFNIPLPVKHDMSRRVVDLLMSPRIRALRGTEIPGIAEEPEEVTTAPAADAHSAFACYLFSHLTTGEPSDEEIASGRRGRTVLPTGAMAGDGSRSTSVDSMVHTRAGSTSARPRASRYIFGRASTEILALPEEIEPMQLTPGRFIAATSESVTESAAVSPFHSPPASPPTVPNRGRSAARRSSRSPDVLASSIDPRGRSHMRGAGAVERDLSPSRDSESSNSRGRSEAASRSRARVEREATSRPVGAFSPVEESISNDIVEEDRGRKGRGRGVSHGRRDEERDGSIGRLVL